MHNNITVLIPVALLGGSSIRAFLLLFITISKAMSIEQIVSTSSSSTPPDTPAAIYTIDDGIVPLEEQK